MGTIRSAGTSVSTLRSLISQWHKGQYQRNKAKTIVCELLVCALVMSLSFVFVAKEFDNDVPSRQEVKPLTSKKNSNKAKPAAIGAETVGIDSPSMDPSKQKYLTPKQIQSKKQVSEMKDERTTNTKSFLNSDGTNTLEYSATPLHYLDEQGNFKDIKTTAKTIKNYDSSAELRKSEVKSTTAISVETADLKATFLPFNRGIDYSYRGVQFSVTPNSGKNVDPKKTEKGKTIVVTYENVFKDVDIEYVVGYGSIKENIILKSKSAVLDFGFKFTGVTLSTHPNIAGAISFKEFVADEFYISPLAIITEDSYIISEQPAVQSIDGNELKISMDKTWLQDQPKKRFPIVIDPEVYNNVGGRSGNFVAYKSDGYVCPSSACTPNAGTLRDANQWKNWRTVLRIPFDVLQGKTFLGSAVSLVQRTDLYGTTEPRSFAISGAQNFNYHCTNPPSQSQGKIITTGEWYDISHTIGFFANSNDWNGRLCLWGSENNSFTFKSFDADNLKLYIVYDTPTPMTTAIAPADKQVTVNTQPSLKVNPVADPDGENVQYYFRVATNPDAETGAVINSGWQNSPQWTVPDNILQDGQTYYWHVYTLGGYQTNPNWVYSFKVDLRTGRDSTQAFQDVGPIGVDLATGNATTGGSTHSISALGGTIGTSLNYNSPAMSRPGLSGQYWNNPSASGEPALTRVDPEINFDWSSGSPSGGVINTDSFYAQWTGFVNVPVTGSYYFGCAGDEWCTIKIDGQTYFSNLQNWGATQLNLVAGKSYALTYQYIDTSGGASTVFKVKGAVAEQVVPSSWFQTGARDIATKYGLVGRYYSDNGTNQFPTDSNDPNRLIMVRNDNKLNFNWGLGSVAPGLAVDNFMVKWKGYITVPTTGSYTLGAKVDDGIGIYIKDQAVLASWSYTGLDARWGSAVNLTAGQQIPITVDYRESNAGASIALLIRGPGLVDQEIPVTWLSPNANVLPDGWNLGVGDGGVRFERLSYKSSSIVLGDNTGETYEYKWVNNAFVSPVGVEASLTKNPDNTYTVLDTDGKTYIFDVEGKLLSVDSPLDDRKPAALKYTYAGNPSRLVKIADGVNAARSGSLYYSGDSNCIVSNGFDSVPTGMLCAFKTTDGVVTRFQYKGGNLSRVELPGNAFYDYGYDSLGRIISLRDVVANDAIAAGVRANDAKATVSVVYDALGRVSTITSPAPTASGARIENKITYFIGSSQLNLTGASEPLGYSRKVEYDSLYRSTKLTDLTGKSATTVWDPVKDQILSTTGPTGLMSTTIYNSNHLPIDTYGPAPSSFFGSDRKPIAAQVNVVPHTSTAYDEGLTGLGVAYYDNKKLLRAPKLNATVTWPVGTNVVTNFAAGASPVAATDGWGARYSGKFTTNAAGNYVFRLKGDAGFRLFIDDQRVIDGWGDGNKIIAENTFSGTYNNLTANSTKRIRIEQYHPTGTASSLQLFVSAPGGAETSAISGLLSPDYGLVTSSKTYDSTFGDVVNQNIYKSPEYGLLEKTVVDPGGLNLENKVSFEAAGSGFFRQTSKTLPGGETTNYSYYAAGETRDNPCTVAVDAANQGGFAKLKTEPDPDGAGAQVGRKSEIVFDASGRQVASRVNSDAWSCITYDARGRAVTTNLPVVGSMSGRTITNNYAVGNNPLVISSADSSGTITVESDLLGRVVKYADTKGKVTSSTYDSFGKLASRSSVLGLEEYAYDNFDRLISFKVDGVVQAAPTYDVYSRVATISYASGVSLTTISRDAMQRENGQTFRLADGSLLGDSVVYSQSGRVVSGSENGVAKTYGYDKASRLTSAVIGANNYAYEFGSTDTSCVGAAGNNVNAAKSSNRTKLTVNGAATTYCYDMADRLVKSSDVNLGVPVYDSHGNTTSLGAVGTKTDFVYDSGDRNLSITETTATKTTKVEYQRDVTSRIISHKVTTNGVVGENVSYGFTGGGDSPDVLMDESGVVKEKYFSLPGGVLLTVKVGDTTPAGKTYSVSNMHGDVSATVNASGLLVGKFVSGPFGEQVAASIKPVNTGSSASWQYVGRHEKLTESSLMLGPIQMGARVFSPSLGRFLGIDPIDGGAENNYTYPQDPVNMKDLSGLCFWDACVLEISVGVLVVGAVVGVVVANEASKNSGKSTSYGIPGWEGIKGVMWLSAGVLTHGTILQARKSEPKKNTSTVYESKSAAKKAAKSEGRRPNCEYRKPCSTGDHFHVDTYKDGVRVQVEHKYWSAPKVRRF